MTRIVMKDVKGNRLAGSGIAQGKPNYGNLCLGTGTQIYNFAVVINRLIIVLTLIMPHTLLFRY